ncbi:MAG: hypothetical protein RI963_3457 [Planctomycetota bacterium]
MWRIIQYCRDRFRAPAMETQPAQAATAAPTKGRGSDAAETTTIYFRVPLSAEHASKLQGDRTHPRGPASPHPAIPNQPQPQPRRQARASADRHRGPSPQAEAAPANRPKGSLRLRAIRFAKRSERSADPDRHPPPHPPKPRLRIARDPETRLAAVPPQHPWPTPFPPADGANDRADSGVGRGGQGENRTPGRASGKFVRGGIFSSPIPPGGL